MRSDLFRIFFVTDIHGSTTCFKKFINISRRDNPPNALILGGDITGKLIIPFIESGEGDYTIPFPESPMRIDQDDAQGVERQFETAGCYVYRCDPDGFRRYKFDPTVRKSVARQLQIQRLTEWLELANERLTGKNIQLIINCGNDDEFYIDDVLKSHPPVVFPENAVVNLTEKLTLLSTGYSSTTPWHCDRELPDEKLEERIARLVEKYKGSFDHCIFNFHCPPKGTLLDLAPSLDAELRPQVGMHGQEFAHVGSDAVLKAIQTLQPVLSLHGHIHEQHCFDHIGRTTIVNPGSSYATGLLQGALITFKGTRLEDVSLTDERLSADTETIQRKLGFSLLRLIPFASIVGDVFIEHPHLKQIKDELSAVRKRLDDELRQRSGARTDSGIDSGGTNQNSGDQT